MFAGNLKDVIKRAEKYNKPLRAINKRRKQPLFITPIRNGDMKRMKHISP